MAKYKVKAKDCQLEVKVKLSMKEKLNERQLDYFSGKYIRGLLKVQARKKNYIEYYGPIGISLFDRLKKPITKYDFLFIMEQIIDTTQKLNLNSLIINNVTWDVHYVFINETTRELQFVYLPLENYKSEANVIGLMEQIIYAAKPMQEADTEYVSRFVFFIKSLSAYDAEKIEKFIAIDTSNISESKIFNFYKIESEVIREMNSILAPVEAEEISLEGSLTKNIDLYTMLNIISADDLDLKKRWDSTRVYKSMAVPLGVSKTGIYFDFREYW